MGRQLGEGDLGVLGGDGIRIQGDGERNMDIAHLSTFGLRSRYDA